MAKRAAEPNPQLIHMGEQILTLAVLSILITAPLGSISILALGPRLLEPELDEFEYENELVYTENAQRMNRKPRYSYYNINLACEKKQSLSCDKKQSFSSLY